MERFFPTNDEKLWKDSWIDRYNTLNGIKLNIFKEEDMGLFRLIGSVLRFFFLFLGPAVICLVVYLFWPIQSFFHVAAQYLPAWSVWAGWGVVAFLLMKLAAQKPDKMQVVSSLFWIFCLSYTVWQLQHEMAARSRPLIVRDSSR